MVHIQSGVIDIFLKFKMAAAAMGPPTKEHSWCVLPVLNLVQISVIVTEIDALMFKTFI